MDGYWMEFDGINYYKESLEDGKLNELKQEFKEMGIEIYLDEDNIVQIKEVN
jgi:hypothetical protein